MKIQAKAIYFNGIVQGVGFRPFVFKLAEELRIKGWVNNSSHGVTIHAEGNNLDLFYQRLLKEAPPLAQIVSARSIEIGLANYEGFDIVESEVEEEGDVLISPDVATCGDCLKDIENSENRYYQFPFTNCTNCGPRYTIIRDVPYDRAQTTMSKFPMCNLCAEDYKNPRDRRFHAQPVACQTCGPKLQLSDALGRPLPGIGVDQLAEGGIIAVKGLGGFHLVCDARNVGAVRRLRERKERGSKPFAVMARSVAKACREVDICTKAENLLQSSAAPIVVLERKLALKDALPEDIAPGIHTLGIILPYTPVHYRLFEGPYDFLVMTSANLSGQPLIYSNEEALEALQGIADYFLMHNRDIYHPCDDSVIQVIGNETVFFRRARGYVPLPILMPTIHVKTPLLGVGGELKNTFCLAFGQRAFMSQYIGDMQGYENLQRYYQELKSFQRVVNITPSAIAFDKHPNYQLTRFALEQPWPKHAVQHHHAHLVSVLGEWDRTEATLGVICDGTGFGEDRCIWGFEFLYGNSIGYERKAHLEYLGLPGGDAGAKQPLRIAYAYLKTLFDGEAWGKTEPLWSTLSSLERQILDRQLETGVQVFQTSSAGRLFDAVSALLGVCTKVTYEGQAAIELESVGTRFLQQQLLEDIVRKRESPHFLYSYEVRVENEVLILGVRPLFEELVRDVLQGVSRGEIAYRFHLTIAEAIVDLALRLGVSDGHLVLSGGVFQNKLLTEAVLRNCQRQGIKVLRSRSLPPGDGGLAFGQLLIANEVL
ncbi:[NiFe] hydrogenase metallocenter assembly protein HypF [Desulfosporosinus sp. I2]|uniref:carbamoyltransferase HypF n=1 Tax=Desulfosporosinus sp. I2 TaxID=1617025 RepID=UPI0005EE0A7C|nr:carbamoyltransferase HypF [Desulfosporosinus sp. I2]KJR48509.1 [NiFe] hydrogenase metallocenter assembly protein HypF [Desulfosporosinus sp. I2]